MWTKSHKHALAMCAVDARWARHAGEVGRRPEVAYNRREPCEYAGVVNRFAEKVGTRWAVAPKTSLVC